MQDFLKKFIEEEWYIQNKPLKTNDFIKFCQKRGLKTNERELEFFEKECLLYPIIRIERPVKSEERIEFEKEGANYWRPAYFGLEKDEKEIRRYEEEYYANYGFDKNSKNYLLDLLEEGNLFDPSSKPYKEWSNFKGKELENDSDKIVHFYSSFQIYWLIILKNSFSINLNLANDKIIVSSSLKRLNRVTISSEFTIDNFNELNEKLYNRNSEIEKLVFNFDNKKKELIKMHQYFKNILKFLLTIQSIYGPYGKSSAKNITFHDEEWNEKKNKFDPKEKLKDLKISINEIEALYGIFSQESVDILEEKSDWIQLWKSIDWGKKDKVEGNFRLGIEYLQWALMVKRFLEDYCQREILDIDEISNISRNDILDYNPSEMDQHGILLRASRNKLYSNPINDEKYYHNKYKRLYYLANDFGIDYHPRLVVFVEGKTELKMLPKFFELIGNGPENLGIDFINIGGISKFFGPRFKVKNSENKYNTIILNNFLNLINYTLNNWQTLPFFVGDDENQIKKLLSEGISIDYDYGSSDTNMPEKWYHIWNKDFELDNFTNKELKLAINQVLSIEITESDIEKVRSQKEGIKSLNDQINDPGIKIEIANVLYENLVQEFLDTKDKSLLQRPIFDLVKKIKIMALRNHPPTNTLHEFNNKETIFDIMEKKE